MARAALAALSALTALTTLTAPTADAAFENITIQRLRLTMEQLHTITIDVNTEYIMDFIPTEEQGQWPTRLWVRSDGGDTSHPLLLTHRQREGAGTWQLPAWVDGRLLFELERTLCPDGNADNSSDCVDPNEAKRAPGWFSLHAVSACARALRVELQAAPARDFALRPRAPLITHITPERPRVHYYTFEPEQDSVRLILASQDDVCATIAIQDYECPIAETLSQIEGSISRANIRMTMQRSAAVQLSRERFPRGFYIVCVAHATDQACEGEASSEDDWLWEAAVLGEPRRVLLPRARLKRLTLDTRPALTRAQYVVAAAVMLAFFLAFYVAFGLLVLAQRWPRFGRLVKPKAVLKDINAESGLQSQADTSQSIADTPARRRRASDATFDSSDNSDTDTSETDAPAAAPRAVNGANGTSAPGIAPTAPRAPAPAVLGASGAERPPPYRADDSAPDGTVSVVDGAALPRDGVDVQQGAAADPARHPYGLPARLRVAALARRKARVLRARSDRYLTTLATVALFYALPVVQFVVAFQIILNRSGSLDLCYYNFLCAHPAGQLSDFNHVLSNLGYLLLGGLFMLQLQRRHRNREKAPRDEEYGIPAHYGLLASLGAGMMVVALLSASYHVCPNGLNFQFDVAFMYVLAVVSMVKIYQSRHPDVNARAHSTFGVLAVLIAIVVWGVLGGGALFWGVFTVLHVFTVLLLSLRIYYIGQFRLEKETFQWAARELRALPARGVRPLYSARLVLLLVANAFNWGFALYGLLTQGADFASHLLYVLLGNTLVYIVFYLAMKLLHGERPRWYAWLYLGGAAAAWAPALYFFSSGASSWSSTPAQSRHRNHECSVLEFYDSHDLWHMLSAVALYLTFNALLTWDDGLAAVPRSEIAVF